MTQDAEVEIRASSRKERQARRGSKRFARWRLKIVENKVDWDLRLLRLWGGLLILGFLFPIDHRDGGFRFLWSRFDSLETMHVLWTVSPLLLGALAIGISASPKPKVRGLVVLVGSLVVVIGPVVTVGPTILGKLPRGVQGLVAIALIVLLAPPVVAGANHALRRSREDMLCRALVGLGGLAMLLALFLPIGPRDQSLVVALFGDSGLLGPDNFLVMIWLLIVLMFAVVATLYLYPRLNARRLGGWLSMAARFALWAPAVFMGVVFVIVLVGAIFQGEFPRDFLEDFIPQIGVLERLYGLLILAAVGWALVLEDPPKAEASESR